MTEKLIDQNIFHEVLEITLCVLLPEANGRGQQNSILELFPATTVKCSGLLIDQTLNNRSTIYFLKQFFLFSPLSRTSGNF